MNLAFSRPFALMNNLLFKERSDATLRRKTNERDESRKNINYNEELNVETKNDLYEDRATR